MNANKGSSGGAVVAVFLILVLIVVFLYFSGYLHLPTSAPSNKVTGVVSAYSFSSSVIPSSNKRKTANDYQKYYQNAEGGLRFIIYSHTITKKTHLFNL